jgi:hypothetical protein
MVREKMGDLRLEQTYETMEDWNLISLLGERVALDNVLSESSRPLDDRGVGEENGNLYRSRKKKGKTSGPSSAPEFESERVTTT